MIVMMSVLTSSFASASGPSHRIVTGIYPPFIEQPGQNSTGVVVTIVKEAFKSVHMNARFVVVPFPRAISFLAKKTESIGFFDPETLRPIFGKDVSCVPFMQYNATLFQLPETKSKPGLSKVAGMYRGNPVEKKLLQAMNLEVVETGSHLALFEMLRIGRLHSVSTVDLTGLKVLKSEFTPKFRAKVVMNQKPYHQGKAGLCFFGPASQSSKQAFQKGLSNIYKNGRFQETVKAFLSSLLPPRQVDSYFEQHWGSMIKDL